MGGQQGNKKKGGGKKNPGVGVDFAKVKTKVGKKLARAQNETDTSFKAASINLPSQGLKEDREGVAVNSHNLTLKVCVLGGGERAGSRKGLMHHASWAAAACFRQGWPAGSPRRLSVGREW